MSAPTFTLPLPAADFLRDYWQQKPLVMRQAATSLDLIDGDTLAGLSLEDGVESRLITGAGQGPWQLQKGPLDEALFGQLPERDWTLLVQSVDHYFTEISLLLDSFSFLPTWRLEDIMISYAVKGGSVGPHFDPYDVFLVQAKGTRRWKIGQSCSSDTPLLAHPSLKLLQDFQCQEEHLMQPGDVLYLPPGVAHWGISESDDCITWSVGFRAPDLYQLLDWLLAESEENRTPLLFADPGRAVASPALTAQDLAALLNQTGDALRQLPLASLLTRWLSLPRQDTLDLLDVDAEALQSICSDAALVRHGGARLLLEDETAQQAWVNGEGFAIAPAARPLVKQLASKRWFTEQELAPLLTHTDATSLLDDWIERGYFYSIE